MNRLTSIRIALAVAASAAFAAPILAGAGGPRELGIWYDDTGKGAVKIDVCGGKLCGHIYWLKNPLNAEGKPLFDRHNPNENQRSRAICGLQVIGGLAAMDDGTWDLGWIYDPKEGKSYSVATTLTEPDTLKVTGYLVMKMMGRTLTWKRAPDDLPSCVQNAAAPEGGAAKPAADAAAAKKAATSAKGAANKAGKEELPWDSKK